jgi:hypothetical protein
MSTITVHPAFDAYYYGYYIQGLIDLFGASNIQFSSRRFPNITNEFLAFILNGTQEVRVVVDAYDGVRINNTYFEWCDVYGKVNAHPSFIPTGCADKYVPIGPSFGIQVWSWYRAWPLALRNYLQGKCVGSAREHFANYRRQYSYRLPLNLYTPAEPQERYVFFLSSLWGQGESPGVDEYRALFVQSCKSFSGLTFEGGFAPPQCEESRARFREHITSKRVSFAEWLENTKRSTLVFNTPAILFCHGWKLGEYLALGKAIISTPLWRDLPAPLVHEQHVHYVDGSKDAIRDGISRIVSNHDYRNHLEQNARAYYLKYLSPERVIERLLGALQQPR